MKPATATYRYTTLRDRVEDVLKVFETAGYEPISLPIIQPADLFLDTMGESVRGRTYLFDDHYGHELCLRPDLTVPTCRYFLATNPSPGRRVRYSYYGPVFRFQQDGVGLGQPGEIRQTGIECFGEKDTASADAEVLRLTLDALRAAGLKRFDVTIGDIGIFTALLGAIDMPERWRHQLQHHFFQPSVFDRFFAQLRTPKARRKTGLPKALARSMQQAMDRALHATSAEDAEAAVSAYLSSNGIPHLGNRTAAEIAGRVIDLIADAEQSPLSARHGDLIEAYLRLRDVAPREAQATIRDLVAPAGVDLGAALQAFAQRLRMFAKTGVDAAEMTFSAAIGRDFEYYTGFVFEVSTADAAGGRVTVAGGGRYDGLIKAVDGRCEAPAVGAAIYMDRLLAVVRS